MGSVARSLGASDLEDATDAFLLVMYRLPRPSNYGHLVRLQKRKKCNHLNAVTELIKATLTEQRYDTKLYCFIPYIRITFHYITVIDLFNEPTNEVYSGKDIAVSPLPATCCGPSWTIIKDHKI